jgi:hypothetical protein
MIYSGSNEFDVRRAIERIKHFYEKGKDFELKEKRQRKSIAQNNYFHLICYWFAIEYGETAEYIKQVIVKQIVCPEIFKTEYANTKTGEIREAWKSFSELSKDETNVVITKFRNYASKEAGIYLPDVSDLFALQEIEKQIENQKEYL